MKGLKLKFYLFAFFDDFLFIYPFYVLMFKEYGLSAFNISILLFVWALTSLFMEVPSGALADKFSRKWLIVWGQIIRLIGLGFWLFYPTLLGFMIGFIAWGTKEAIASGTFEALLYDELKSFKIETEFTKIFGRVKAMVFTAIFLSSVAASMLIKCGYTPIIIGSMISVGLSAFFITIIPETKKYKHEQSEKFTTIFKDGIRYSVRKKRVLIILSFIALIFGFAGSLEEFWPLFGKELSLSKEMIALMFGFVSLSMAIGSTIAHKFEKISIRYHYLAHLFGSIFIAISAMLSNRLAALLLIPFFFIHQVVFTALQGKLQRIIPSSRRATISSMIGFLGGASALVLFLFFGWVSEIYNFRAGFLAFGILLIIITIPYLVFSRNKRIS